jgi:hypothetical protein
MFVERSRNLMGRVGPADHSRVGAVTGCFLHNFENAKTVTFSQSEAIQRGSAAPVPGSSGLSLKRLDPLADLEYSAFLNHPAATLFHAPPWLRAVAEAYGFKFWSYVATDSAGNPVGAIAYCEIDDLAGKRIVCVPFSDAWDPLVRSSGAWNQLFDALKSHGLPLRFRCLNEDCVSASTGIQVAKTSRWHRLSVEDSKEELWRRITPEARRAIRKSQRSGVEIRALCGDQDLSQFHRLHVALRKR